MQHSTVSPSSLKVKANNTLLSTKDQGLRESTPLPTIMTFQTLKKDTEMKGRFFDQNESENSVDLTMAIHLSYNRFVCLPEIMKIWKGYSFLYLLI